jgi:hypothetical protein
MTLENIEASKSQHLESVFPQSELNGFIGREEEKKRRGN